MVQYRGKCAACGVSWCHKNFRGCREGRLIPKPCFVVLQKRRPEKDNRLCCRCYESHLAKVPAEPATHVTPVTPRHQSSASSLDGVHWSEPASERVAKVVRRSLDGVQTIPPDLHEQKMDELKDAMRMESQIFLMSIPSQMALHEKCDWVQAAICG